METDFGSWLDHELSVHGWSQSEAARRGNISASTIQQVIAGTTRPGVKLCRGIARAFNMPAEDVMRRAGLLPLPPGATENDRRSLRDAMRKFERLTEQDQRRVSDLINRLLGDDE